MDDSEPCLFGVLTASDRASSGEYDDIGGPAIESFLRDAVTSQWKAVRRLVADDKEIIEGALTDLIDNQGCSVGNSSKN